MEDKIVSLFNESNNFRIRLSASDNPIIVFPKSAANFLSFSNADVSAYLNIGVQELENQEYKYIINTRFEDDQHNSLFFVKLVNKYHNITSIIHINDKTVTLDGSGAEWFDMSNGNRSDDPPQKYKKTFSFNIIDENDFGLITIEGVHCGEGSGEGG